MPILLPKHECIPVKLGMLRYIQQMSSCRSTVFLMLEQRHFLWDRRIQYMQVAVAAYARIIETALFGWVVEAVVLRPCERPVRFDLLYHQTPHRIVRCPVGDERPPLLVQTRRVSCMFQPAWVSPNVGNVSQYTSGVPMLPCPHDFPVAVGRTSSQRSMAMVVQKQMVTA